ncbi:MAG: hypothetical protein ACR2OY_07655 [Boseongicola sp.]
MGFGFAAIFAAMWCVRWKGNISTRRAHVWHVPLIAVAASAAVVVLRFVAHHNYDLSIDEFMPTFQAEIFRAGYLLAPIEDAFLSVQTELQPFFTYVDEDRKIWGAHYRPVHAAILALFPANYAVVSAHALLTGITILATADIVRRLFPQKSGGPVLATLLLVTSPQVLLTAASGFSFTAHLALNSVWLALFLRGSWRAHICACVVGFFATGIHQVHVHILFVFPFGVAMLIGIFGDRLKAIPYFVAYILAVPLWVLWPEVAVWLQTGDVSVFPRTLLDADYLSNYVNRSERLGSVEQTFSGLFLVTNIWRFMLWMSPALLLLLILVTYAGRRIGIVAIVCGLGIIFNILVTHLLIPNQMHTLGSRYYHAFFVNFIILGLSAYYAFFDSDRFSGLRNAVTLSLLLGATFFLPLRAYQVHQKIAPRAHIQSALGAMDFDAIVIGPSLAWFAADFVRNDPFQQNRPKFYFSLDSEFEPPSATSKMVIELDGLHKLGLPRGTFLEPAFEPRPSLN